MRTWEKLANILLDHSLELKANDKLIIETIVEAKDLNKEILIQANKRGVYAELNLSDDDYKSLLLENKNNNIDNLEVFTNHDINKYKDIDGVIAIRGFKNEFSAVDVDPILMQDIQRKRMKLSEVIMSKKWILINYPTHAMAQKAKMSYDKYVEFCNQAMCSDYKAMRKNLLPLKELFNKTDKVHITSPGTNITFSIKGIDTVICSGENNIPDGEVFTAPVKESVNGVIKYNTYSIQQNKRWDNIELTFENGKIVKSTCDNASEDELSKLFDIDDGARYTGEFSIGVNNNIKNPIGDILYDEKIGGSFHLTPGVAYEDANNGNKSSLHWDLVLIQNESFGGGEIYFDDVLIRKDGKFVIEELLSLND